MAFAAYTGLIVIWFCLHLLAARWALLRLRSDGRPEIDGEFVRIEGFLASEAREGRIGADLRFEADGIVSGGTVVTGVIAGGSLALLEGARVSGFADSHGELDVQARCTIAGRATSRTAIRLRGGASVRSCSAPEITTEPVAAGAVPEIDRPAGTAITLPSCEGKLDARIEPLGADTWICHGDLVFAGPVILEARLAVRGLFSVGPGSELNADLKAGEVRIGEGSVCRAGVVSRATLRLGPGCLFEKILYSGGDLHLGERVRGEANEAVVAWGAKTVFVGRGVLIRGKIAAGEQVVALG